jgi:hypothetical protein
MSWIDKELKRRARAATTASAPAEMAPAADPQAVAEQAMHLLWQKLESANAALPAELRLQREEVTSPPSQGPRFRVWLRAPNGAALGFAGDAVRYLWPERNKNRSHNFWIRWNAERGHHELSQRITAAVPPLMKQSRLDEARLDRLLQHLVQGRRIKPGALRKKRLWLF